VTSVTIIGAGNMARGIATRLLSGGTQVQILARSAEPATALATELRGTVTGAAVDQPITGDVVVLATPYDGALAFAAERGVDLSGRIVVDITNPVDWSTFEGVVTPTDSSAAEEIARRLPAGVLVVKAFNTTRPAWRPAASDQQGWPAHPPRQSTPAGRR
jgi:predicted dinucleotide-binding enzyme